MKRYTTTLLSILLGTIAIAQEHKVLFIGGSISQGEGVVNPERNSLPAQLKALLGADAEVGVVTPNSDTFIADSKLIETIDELNPTHIYFEVGSQHRLKESKLKPKQMQKSLLEFQKDLKLRYPNSSITMIMPTDTIEPFSDYDSLVKLNSRAAQESGFVVKNIKQLYPNRDAFRTKDHQPTSLGANLVAWELFLDLKKEELKEDSIYINPASMAIPGAEYRASTGWREGADWHDVSNEISTIAQTKKCDVLLLGNSITQGWGGERSLITHKPGRLAADSEFAGFSWMNCGIAGDKTQQLIHRLENGKYESCEPKVVVLTIGVNNLSSNETAQGCFEGIVAVVEKINLKMPNSKVLLLGPLPALAREDKLRGDINDVHNKLSKQDWNSSVRYINPGSWFLNEDGNLLLELYSRDLLHLSNKGYEKWAKSMRPIIEEMIK
ncbi:MAG: GDSL-type esterase/lipase family protein [Bacteroidales bacterium]